MLELFSLCVGASFVDLLVFDARSDVHSEGFQLASTFVVAGSLVIRDWLTGLIGVSATFDHLPFALKWFI